MESLILIGVLVMSAVSVIHGLTATIKTNGFMTYTKE